MIYVFWISFAAVVAGHFLFAYSQWFKWPDICKKLTDLTEEEAHKTASLGRSFASYNASIGVGLCLSLLLPISIERPVQGVVLAMVVATAAVGASGTRGHTILVTRLLPALVAFLALLTL